MVKCPECGAEIDYLNYTRDTREHGDLTYEIGPMSEEPSLQMSTLNIKIREFTIFCPECSNVLDITEEGAEELLKGGE